MLRKDFLASFFLGAYASQEGQGFGLSYFLFVCCYLVGLWGPTKGEEEYSHFIAGRFSKINLHKGKRITRECLHWAFSHGTDFSAQTGPSLGFRKDYCMILDQDCMY